LRCRDFSCRALVVLLVLDTDVQDSALLLELQDRLNSEHAELSGVPGADVLASLLLSDTLGVALTLLLVLAFAELLLLLVLLLRGDLGAAESARALRRVSLSWHCAASQLLSRLVMLMEKSCSWVPCWYSQRSHGAFCRYCRNCWCCSASAALVLGSVLGS
jgi:hypothetical protein